MRDLRWLGIRWQGDVMRQSARLDRYCDAVARLQRAGLLYPCFCSRAQIRAQLALSAPHGAGSVRYPGTCRRLSGRERARRMRSESYALRIDMGAVAACVGDVGLEWQEEGGARHVVVLESIDDAVLVRRDIGISYHLAVVVDDAEQEVDTVIRGEDLRDATPLQRVLQHLLGLPTLRYIHHPLLRDGSGRRLAKRDDDTTLYGLARAGIAPGRLRQALLAASPPPSWETISSRLAASISH